MPGPDPGGTVVIDLNGGDDFSCGWSGKTICRMAVADHMRLLTSVCVTVA